MVGDAKHDQLRYLNLATPSSNVTLDASLLANDSMFTWDRDIGVG